jgi:cytochrome c-type biogenesis protein CcmF
MVSLGIWMAVWIVASVTTGILARVRQRKEAGVEVGTISRSYYGMQLAHLGVAVFIVGVTLVNGYEEQKDVRVDVGDTVEVRGYTFRFDGVSQAQGPNYVAERGRVTVFHDGSEISVMFPEKRFYNVQQQVMTEAAIDTGLFGDLYVSLGEPLDRGAWSIRVYAKPFIDWIWGGCVLMGLGGLFAITDKRYRIASRKENLAPSVAKSKASIPSTSSEAQA